MCFIFRYIGKMADIRRHATFQMLVVNVSREIRMTMTQYSISALGVMVFNASFYIISVISWRPVLFVEETGVP
jgi:hypothetical protein